MDMYDNNKSRISWNSIFAMILYTVMIAILMVWVYSGARIYRSEDANRQHASKVRKTTAYIENKLMEGDSSGWISVASKADLGVDDNSDTSVSGKTVSGDTIVIKEEDSSYSTLIYQYNGKLYEELTKTGTKFDPARASVICNAGSFTVREENGMIITDIDGEKNVYAIRSEGK